ncbi:MAG: aldose 1-epimerase family protein [Clostridia bacterium]|nr:aldose 1-epimerase family protein [Clostridia bacterium]
MITLKNEFITAHINEAGAELKSLVYNGTEQIWEGKPEVWDSSCPLLFPICGGLKDDRYLYDGKEYHLQKHGFVRTAPFEVERADDTFAVFCIKSNDETKKQYPFDYELRVIYTLTEKTLKIEYEVRNECDRTMYFSIGSHEGYYTPEGIEDYDVIFPQKETLNAKVIYGNLISNQDLPIIKDTNVLPLYEKHFIIDALVFTDLKSRSATLRNRKTGRTIHIDFPDMPYFLIWHKPNSPYICIEPWAGLGDVVGTSYNIEEKVGINALDAGKTYRNVHSITFGE